MNPLFNAILGVLFIAAGVVATVLMYHLRGSVTRDRVESKSGAEKDPDDEEYAAYWILTLSGKLGTCVFRA